MDIVNTIEEMESFEGKCKKDVLVGIFGSFIIVFL